MSSCMLSEALEAPGAVARLLAADAPVHDVVVQAFRSRPPTGMVTLARGSSDHAAAYLAYLVMARLHRMVTSLPLSVMTLYDAPARADGLWSIAFSQSGRSPDIVEPTRALRERGARTLALVNDAASPLAQGAEWTLPLLAGPERSVAATKSFIAQLVVGARLVAGWGGDTALAAAIQALPDVLARAVALDWQAGVDALRHTRNLFVVGRGPGMAVAMEVALKLKETCGLHAEALSSAELHHGPKALVGGDFALLVLAPRGPAQAGLLQTAADWHRLGARVLVAAPAGSAPDGVPSLPLVVSGHEDLDPISVVQTVYRFVEALARARGFDPDRPRHLAKVTLTR